MPNEQRHYSNELNLESVGINLPYNMQAEQSVLGAVLLKPETLTDLVEIIEAVEKGALSQLDIQWEDAAAACVILASGGYPQSYEKGLPISGLDAHGQADGVTIYHAGTALADGGYKTAGGRVLGVTAVAPTLREALDAAYAAAGKIDFPKKQFRTDIGAKALS